MRLRATLADYAVVAIAPVLIMFMVGSLVWFLIAVFYQGDFDLRLHWITAMFVMGAVLIARLSIDEGREYAAMFALPLAAVTALAMWRFVEFRGWLAPISPLVSVGLIALIWWSADRITWDCTVLDTDRDASGQGLLQTAGLEGHRIALDEPDKDLDAATDRAVPAPLAPSWWQRFIAARHRPHAPGVWILYFALAALPIFGLGQGFIQGQDLATRRFVFQLLIVYVGSSLALLVTTSFLGLRRYLRQRRLEMPATMAATWLASGGVMIVLALLFALALPRRNPEYSVAHLAPAGSRSDLWTSRFGFGNDGPEKPDGTQAAPKRSPDSAAAPTPNGKQPNGREGNGNQSSSGQSPSGPKGQQTTDGNSSSGASSSPSDSPSQGDSSSRDKGDGGQQSPGERSGPSNQSPDQQPSGPSAPPADESGGSGNEPQEKSAASGDRQGDRPPPAEGDQPQNNDQRKSGKSGPQQPGDQQQEPPRESDDGSSRANAEPPPPASPPPASPNWHMPSVGRLLALLIQLLYWLAVIAGLIWFLWRYGAQVRAAIAAFLQALRDFWQRWLGGHDEAAAAAADAAPTAPPPRPFADFANPFASGQVSRWPIEELVRYTHLALEAWAREHGVPRHPEQTPHEFAASLQQAAPRLGAEAARAAELYGRMLYSGQRLSPASTAVLHGLWSCMVEPSPPNVSAG